MCVRLAKGQLNPVVRMEKRRRLLDGEPGQPPRFQYGDPAPAPLKLRRKIFLSHSGKDKDFVRHLHHVLCNRYHHQQNIVFFDEHTLPKAEPVSMENILLEARQSKLGVLVLTEDFFVRTPNPMRELQEFVAHDVPLLPLFFKMSVDDFRKKKESAVWEEQWRKWPTANMEMWREALKSVLAFNGLEYCKTATNHLVYIDKIVNTVIGIMPPAIKFSEPGVYGMNRLCQVVDDMYKECSLKRSSSDHTQVASASASTSTSTSISFGLDGVVGIYGFAGLGKTTLCHGLCDYYNAEFSGKVCYIDLGSNSSNQASSPSSAFRKRVEDMLNTLASYKVAYQDLTFTQVKNRLRALMSLQDPIFLAIDNVLPGSESQDEVDFYLGCGPFPRGSKIFITSRSRNILEQLSNTYKNFSMVIRHIPKLEFKEAKSIFVHVLCNFESPDLEGELNECVNKCIIHEEWSIREKCIYYPLLLKSVAASIRWGRAGGLKCNLEKFLSKAIDSDANNLQRVFDFLDITYKDMSKEAKIVFLDVALLFNATHNNAKIDAWIQSVHSSLPCDEIDKVLSHLQDLTFIIIKTDTWIQVHDMLVAFSKWKVLQSRADIFPPNLDISEAYLVLEGVHSIDYLVLEKRAHWRCVTISRCGFEKNPTLDLRNVQVVEVLHLVDNSGLRQVLLSPSTCARLRSLIVRVPTSTCCTIMVDNSSTSAALTQYNWSLKWLQLEGNVIITARREERISWMSSNGLSQLFLSLLQSLGRRSWLQSLELTAAPVFELGALGELWNLEFLTLSQLPVQSIDVTSCANLKSLELRFMPSLRSIRGHDKSTNLHSLNISNCQELSELTIPADNFRLSSNIRECHSLERITVCTTSSPAAISPDENLDSSCDPGKLDVWRCLNLSKIDGLSQYTGHFLLSQYYWAGEKLQEILHETNLEDLLDSAGIDSSICKAKVLYLILNRHNPLARLNMAEVEQMVLEDVKHTGPLLSALFKAQPTHLKSLKIVCGDSCGCEKNAPLFGPLANDCTSTEFKYCCSQVRDLSSLSQWDVLAILDLSGCTSVEVWPDFATMTSLRELYLNNTFLKEWPAGLLHVPNLVTFQIRGCTLMPAEELMKVITLEMQSSSILWSIRGGAIESLRVDVEGNHPPEFQSQTRDSWTIVAALQTHLLPELGVRFVDAWNAVAARFHDGGDAVEEYFGGEGYYNPHFLVIQLGYAVMYEKEVPWVRDSEFPWFHPLEDWLLKMRLLLRRIGWYDPNHSNQIAQNKLLESFLKAFGRRPLFSGRPLTISSYHWKHSYLQMEFLRYQMMVMKVALKVATSSSHMQDLESRVQQDYNVCQAQYQSFYQIFCQKRDIECKARYRSLCQNF